jgi:hypothetical protein
MATFGKISYIFSIVVAVVVGSMFTTRTAINISGMEETRSGVTCHIGHWEYEKCEILERDCKEGERTYTFNGDKYACKDPLKILFNNRICHGNKVKCSSNGFCDYTRNCEKGS